ncbi:MAG: hypothetical protein RH942_03875 [Kiloniellaceae bacterium]
MTLKLYGRVVLLGLTAIMFTSCSFGPQISEHAIDYNRSVEEAHNSQLLLNVLRASDRRPMHFTAISQVRGSFQLSTTGNISITLPFGGDAASAFPLTPSINISESSSPSFDVAVLDSQEFIRGILSPIELSTFKYFWDQGWPDQLLLYLLVHKFTPQGAEPLVNTPGYDNGCETERANAVVAAVGMGSFCRFREWVNKVTAPGGRKLQFGVKKNAIAIGPPVDFSDPQSLEALVRVAESDKKLQIFDDQYNTGKQRLCRIVESPTFCEGECPRKNAAELADECTKPEATKTAREKADTAAGEAGIAAVISDDGIRTLGHIELRSVQSVIYYLGEVIRKRRDPIPNGVGVRIGRNTVNSAGIALGLFELNPINKALQADRVRVEYENIQYAVSAHGTSVNPNLVGNLSGTALSLVTQLMALQKNSKELPTTTAVETVGQ